MTTPSLTTSQLEQILELSKKKDSIAADLEKIDQQIEAIYGRKTTDGSAPATAAKTRKPRAKRTASPGGGLKEQILAVLQSAGEDGLSVKDIAAKIGAKRSSVNVWLYTTGKKVAGLKKVGRGRFALNGKTPNVATVEPFKTRKSRTIARNRKPRTVKSSKAEPSGAGATIKDQVLAVLRSAGEAGLSVAEIARNIGGNKNSINNWIYTAGKKVKELKKLGRGRFGFKG